MGLNESDTRAKLIDPAIHARGWTEDLIRREETAGAIEIIDGNLQDIGQLWPRPSFSSDVQHTE